MVIIAIKLLYIRVCRNVYDRKILMTYLKHIYVLDFGKININLMYLITMILNSNSRDDKASNNKLKKFYNQG